MTNEELVKEYQEGNEKALEQLLEDNEMLINAIVRKFYTEKTASISRDDLVQEGNIGLIVAAQKYKIDMDKKAKFSTYAAYWVYQKVNRFMRYRNTNEETSLDKPIGDGENTLGDVITVEDMQCSVEESVYLCQLREEVDRALREDLTLLQRQTILMRYGFDCEMSTLSEIADIIGVTREQARQIEIKALMKLRRSEWGKRILAEHRMETGKRINNISISTQKAWDGYVVHKTENGAQCKKRKLSKNSKRLLEELLC